MTGADVGLALGEKNAWKRGYGTEKTTLLLERVSAVEPASWRVVDLRREYCELEAGGVPGEWKVM